NVINLRALTNKRQVEMGEVLSHFYLSLSFLAIEDATK
ncbi:hypothetical protein C8U37_1441, partial [Trichococcus patagoniensis]